MSHLPIAESLNASFRVRQKATKTSGIIVAGRGAPSPPGCDFVEDFRKASCKCRSPLALTDLLAAATRDLGFRHFALLHHEHLCGSGWTFIRLHNYPTAWEAHLSRQMRRTADPVHQASARRHAGFSWDEMADIIRLDSAQIGILADAKRFGLVHGYTRPVNVPGEPRGSCSFTGPRQRSSPSFRQVAELIGGHAFEAARRIYGYTDRYRCPHLSRREMECLRLLAAGKTDREIAMILNLSPATVHQYVKRARAAYDVVSRSQLVSRGLRDSLIAFDDRTNLGK